MPADVEVRVVDPGRRGDPERGRCQPSAGAREPVEAGGDARSKPVEVEGAPTRARLDDGELQGVPRDRLGLEAQDPVVVGAETLHRRPVIADQGATARTGRARRGAADPRARLLDGDLALHAEVLVAVDRAVELVLARLQVHGERSALTRLELGLQLL